MKLWSKSDAKQDVAQPYRSPLATAVVVALPLDNVLAHKYSKPVPATVADDEDVSRVAVSRYVSLHLTIECR